MSEFHEWNQQIMAEFRANGGKVGGQFEGAPVLILHSIGAKSGLERTHPLMYQQVGTGVAVFASKAGQATNPDWYHNLVANPEVTVELADEAYQARARVAEEPERTRLFRAQAEKMPNFAAYEKATTRKIPVVVLERA